MKKKDVDYVEILNIQQKNVIEIMNVKSVVEKVTLRKYVLKKVEGLIMSIIVMMRMKMKKKYIM